MNPIKNKEYFELAREQALKQLRIRPLIKNRLENKIGLDHTQMSYLLFSMLQSQEITFKLKHNVFTFMINDEPKTTFIGWARDEKNTRHKVLIESDGRMKIIRDHIGIELL